MTLKLYKVCCRGMTKYVSPHEDGVTHGIAYVVAPDPTTAYAIMRESLDARGLGTTGEREFESMELLASEEELPDCKMQLHLWKKKEGKK